MYENTEQLYIIDAFYLEWDSLCRMKRKWESFPSLTRERQRVDVVTSLLNNKTLDSKFFKELLVNLRLILIRAGLEERKGIHILLLGSQLTIIAIRLVTSDVDKSSRFDVEDLWVDCEKWGPQFWDKADDCGVDENTPLLPLRSQYDEKSIWSWRRWFPLFVDKGFDSL